MTDRQCAMLRYIRAYKAAHDGCAPSNREIGQACGISSSSVVNFHLGRLERQGLITRLGKQARTIQVTGGRWTAPGEPPA